jgi:hypothetical protein
MDYRSSTKLLIKLAGAIFLFQAVELIPGAVSAATKTLAIAHVPWPLALPPLLFGPIFTAIVGLALFLWPGKVANRFFAEDSISLGSPSDSRIQEVALSVLATYFVITGVAQVGFDLTSLLKTSVFAEASGRVLPEGFVTERCAHLAFAVIQIVFGVALFLGVRWLVAAQQRFLERGSKKPGAGI